VISALVITASNRAARGVYPDRSGPVLAELLGTAGCAVDGPVVVPDGEPVEAAMRSALADGYDVVVTTGGTGLTPGDLTPEMTRRVIEREIPGIAEALRAAGAAAGVPSAILSRGAAGVAGRTLIVNLPGQPKSIRETLEGLRDADSKPKVPGIFAAVPYCIDLIGGPYIETRPEVVTAFRPKNAIRRWNDSKS